MELVTRNCQWLEVIKDVGKYVDSCDMYQRIKNRIEKKLKLSKVLKKPQIHLIVDFTTKLLLVAKKDVILVICNKLSKIAHFMAITERMLAEELAMLFRDNM